MPIAIHSSTNARLWSTERTAGGLAELVEKKDAKNEATTNTAPVTNHFSWRRSSPADPRNRITSATREVASEDVTDRTSRTTNRPSPDGDAIGSRMAREANMYENNDNT